MKATLEAVTAAIEADAKRRNGYSIRGVTCGPDRLRARYSTGFFAPDRYELIDVNEALRLIRDGRAQWMTTFWEFNLWVTCADGTRFDLDVPPLDEAA